MPLVDVVRDMRADFSRRRCPVPIFLGEQFLADHAEVCRVVIVPSDGDTYGGKSPSLRPVTPGPLNPRPILSRAVAAKVNIWAGAAMQPPLQSQLEADMSVLDALINITLAALYGVAGGDVQIGSGRNVTGQAVHVRRGLVYEFDILVGVPILDLAWPGIPVMGEETFGSINASANISITEQLSSGAVTVHNFTAPTPEES